MKKLIIAVAFGMLMAKGASAQMIVQNAYSVATEANITVSSSAVTQIDSTQKVDRRMVILQNTGTNDAWCALSASPAVGTGFLLTHISSTVTAGYAVPNMLQLAITANIKVYCLAAAGATAKIRIVQLR